MPHYQPLDEAEQTPTTQGLDTARITMQRRSVAQEIYMVLRDGILRGLYKPGEALRQEALAHRFQTSRAPVREALGRIESEGLVILRPRRGYIVSSLDTAEITEIFRLRTLLEEHASHVGTQARTHADIEAVGSILDQMEQVQGPEPADTARWIDLHRSFHYRLFSSAPQKHTINTLNTLCDLVDRYLSIDVSLTGHDDPTNSEHRQIYEAFKAGNADKVAALSRRHCEHTAERLLIALEQGQ